MDFNKIAQLILFHRKKAGLSRNDLADIAGVGKTVVYDIEHGKDSIQFSSLSKIFDALNIQLDFKSPFMNEFKDIKQSEL
jgi:HTH-type transcriptional regulator / antitoxin HipB